MKKLKMICKEKINLNREGINKYNREWINFQSEKDDWRTFEKNNVTTAVNVLYAKKEKNILLMFQNIIHIVKNKLFF